MKKIIVLALSLLLAVVCSMALAQPEEIRVPLNEENLKALEPHAAYATISAEKVALREPLLQKNGKIRVMRTNKLIIRNNPIDIWGTQVEGEEEGTTELAVTILYQGADNYIYVTSKKGEGLIPISYTEYQDWNADEFRKHFRQTPGSYKEQEADAKTDAEPKPGDIVVN